MPELTRKRRTQNAKRRKHEAPHGAEPTSLNLNGSMIALGESITLE